MYLSVCEGKRLSACFAAGSFPCSFRRMSNIAHGLGLRSLFDAQPPVAGGLDAWTGSEKGVAGSTPTLLLPLQSQSQPPSNSLEESMQ